MSKIWGCPTCLHGWQVAGDLDEVQGLARIIQGEAENFPCITPLCSGRMFEMSYPLQGFIVTEVPVRVFYRAIHGFGNGEGDSAQLNDFVELLKSKKIVEINASRVGQPERVILQQLILDDGTRLHFDSSARGACCYYIERPGKSCVEVVEDEFRDFDSDRKDTSRGSNQDREET